MENIIALTQEFFAGPTGIEVDIVVIPEQELIEDIALAGIVTLDVLAFDNFVVSDAGQRRLLVDLTPLAEADVNYDLDDIIASVRSSVSVDGQLFGAPFYAESSIVMFNQEVIDAAGITVPEQPTWDEIADIAAQSTPMTSQVFVCKVCGESLIEAPLAVSTTSAKTYPRR